MSSILEAANRHRLDAERTRLALSGVLGEEAKQREEDRAWCHQVSTRVPIAMWEVERLLARMNNSRARTLKHFTDAGCEFPPEIHEATKLPPKAKCLYRGAVSADFSGDSITMNLPDGRSVVLPMEVREDGIYALIDEAAQAIIDDAVRVARERRQSIIAFGTPEPPAPYAYTSPSMKPAPRTRAGAQRTTGKRAQRRMNKPWAQRR